MWGTGKEKVKSCPSYEIENRRKPSKKFQKSKFYIVREEVGERASEKSNTKFGQPNSSPTYSRWSVEGNSENDKYISHSPEYYLSPEKNVPQSPEQSQISPNHVVQYPEESFRSPFYSIHSLDYTPQTSGNTLDSPDYSPRAPGYVFHSLQAWNISLLHPNKCLILLNESIKHGEVGKFGGAEGACDSGRDVLYGECIFPI